MPSKGIIKKILVSYCCVIVLLFLGLGVSQSAKAADLQFTPNVSIGAGFQQGTTQPVNESTLGNYVSAWYSLIVGVIGILATVMVMYGGFRWLTSGGGAAKNEAKDIIFSALIGLVLTFLSYTILSLINPNLLTIGLPKMEAIEYSENFNLVPVNPANISAQPLVQKANLSPESAAEVRDWLAAHEGMVTDKNGQLLVYKDQKGNLTAGTGHLLRYANGNSADSNTFNVIRNGQPMTVTGANVQAGDIITQQQAESWFANDIAEAANGARGYASNFNTLPTAAQTVATDLAYQYGPAGANTNFPGFFNALNSGSYDQAANILANNSSYNQNYGSRAADNINALRSIK